MVIVQHNPGHGYFHRLIIILGYHKYFFLEVRIFSNLLRIQAAGKEIVEDICIHGI